MQDQIDNVDWAVIHHNSLQGLMRTVDSLLSNSLSRKNGLILDNSENSYIESQLVATLGGSIKLVFLPNQGYGNAANKAIEYFASASGNKYLLISTHDVAIEPETITNMVNVLESEENLSACGPVLLGGSYSTDKVWSSGGTTTPYLRLLGHANSGRQRASFEAENREGIPAKAAWLDGAFILYRKAAILDFRFDERYFLYFEETDLHIRMASERHSFVVATNAFASQSTTGVPGFYLAQNIVRFQRSHGRRGFRFIAVTLGVLRHLATLKNGKPFLGELKGILRGLASGLASKN